MSQDQVEFALKNASTSPRLVQGAHFRFNADLPRGSHLPAGEAEMALDEKIRQVEQAAGHAWGEGRRQVAAEMADKLKLHDGFSDALRKTLSFDLARHEMRPGGSHDQDTHPFFEPYRRLAAEMPGLREQTRDLLAARVGAPEFECMQQLGDFDRPQTQTPAFATWFGNSKVVDAEGRPLIAFHGSGVEIDSFQTRFDEFRTTKNQNWAGQMGAWFAAPSPWADYEPSNAEATAQGFAESAAKRRAGEGAVLYPVYLSIRNPYEMEGHDDFLEQLAAAGGVEAFRRSLEAKGHDGFVIEGCCSDGDMLRNDWVAFHASQIKSAIGNSGAFCKDNPDLCDREPMTNALQQRAAQATAFVKSLVAHPKPTP